LLIIVALESKIKDLETNIDSQFSDLRQIPYRISSAFFHVGSHMSGHYWIYIYDFRAKIWRKYNDEKVTEVTDTTEIFDAHPGERPPTAYFIVYVKDDLKEELVDPVCRNVVESTPQEAEGSQDVGMDDYVDIQVPTTIDIASVYRSINPDVGSTMTSEHQTWRANTGWDSGVDVGRGYNDW